MSEPEPLPIETSVGEVDSLRKSKTPDTEFILLDVREQHEYDATRIEGSRLMPMSEIQTRVEELRKHQDDHIVVLCHHGGRSMHVTQLLRSLGFTRVQNMAGGIDQWSLQIDATVPRY